MLDANGRKIEVGDWVATPYPRLVDCPTPEMMAAMPAIIKGAILGKVIEIVEDFQGECVHLGDGIPYGPKDIMTLSGLKDVTCPECGMPWPFDVRMNDVEECPFCNYELAWAEWEHLISDDEPYTYDDVTISDLDEMEWDAEIALHGGQLAEF